MINPEIQRLYRRARTHRGLNPDARECTYPDVSDARDAIRIARVHAWATAREDARTIRCDREAGPGDVYTLTDDYIPPELSVELHVSPDYRAEDPIDGLRDAGFTIEPGTSDDLPPRASAAFVRAAGPCTPGAWIWQDPAGFRSPRGMARGPAHAWQIQEARIVADRAAAHAEAVRSGEIRRYAVYAVVTWQHCGRRHEVGCTDVRGDIEGEFCRAATVEYLDEHDGEADIRDLIHDWRETVAARLTGERDALARTLEALAIDQTMREARR